MVRAVRPVRHWVVAALYALLLSGCGRYSYEPLLLDDFRIDGGDDASVDATVEPLCGYQCALPTDGSATDCVGPEITLDTSVQGVPRAVIDMTGYTHLRIKVEFCDPLEFAFGLGDSDTNDGFGGDAGTFSNDAEITLYQGTLLVHDSTQDFDTLELLNEPDFIPADGCVSRELVVADQHLEVTDLEKVIDDPELLRINPPTDTEGDPDALWYLGLNGVPRVGSSRVGVGAKAAQLCMWSGTQ